MISKVRPGSLVSAKRVARKVGPAPFRFALRSLRYASRYVATRHLTAHFALRRAVLTALYSLVCLTRVLMTQSSVVQMQNG
jgi:hypothetical protein